jgi:hypothetical protein
MVLSCFTNFLDLLLAFVKVVFSYKLTFHVYPDSYFSENCTIDFFAIPPISPGTTRSVNCTIPAEFDAPSPATSDCLEWNVSAHGFHVTFNLTYTVSFSINLSHCLSILYIPSSSFLDVGDAKDRELPAHQPPKFHYLPASQAAF